MLEDEKLNINQPR